MRKLIAMLLCLSQPSWATWSLVNHVAAGSTGNASVTTNAIDTTGATLLIAEMSVSAGSSVVPTDSKNNTWTALTRQASGPTAVQIFYVASPTVGTGHTFTAPSGGFPSICVAAFSGAKASPFNIENGASAASGTSLQTGNITPSQNNELIIAAVTVNGGTSFLIDSGMTITDSINYASGNHMGGGLSYLIQTTGAAINPTWSWTTSAANAAAIASFLGTSGGTLLLNGNTTLKGKSTLL